MRRQTIAVVGGGASGIAAAIGAGRKGAAVIICEKMPALGRKILASGNGRCNLLNEKLDESFYNGPSHKLLKNVFSRFNKESLVDFFKGLGLELHSEQGRIFPVTNQSASVLTLLEIELRRLSVQVQLNFAVTHISPSKSAFILGTKSGKKISAKSVILTGGGKTYPALGSDGSAFALAASLGHRIITPVPDAVPVIVKDPLCHALQGQKICARVRSVIDGKVFNETVGDLLFTKYGLSGTAILDISEEISIAVNRDNKKDAVVCVDMTPFMSERRLTEELANRIGKGFMEDELLAGILPNKFALALKGLLIKKDPALIAASLKDRSFKVSGTRGWNEADFTAGGVDLKEVDELSLESRMKKGLYFAGEVLDVNGKRGGYNLAWAWASGLMAGEEAAGCVE